MGTPVSALIAQVRDEFVFDASDAQILAWLNSKYATMIVDSESLTETVDLGVTDGTAYLTLPGKVVRVRELLIDGAPWTRAAHRDVALLAGGSEALYGTGGVFVPDADASGDVRITLSPAPQAGLSASAYCSVRPDPLTANDSVVTPAEYDEALVNGTAAIGYRRDSEQGGSADQLDALFLAGVEKLRRQTRRLGRSGPRRIRIAWP